MHYSYATKMCLCYTKVMNQDHKKQADSKYAEIVGILLPIII